MEVFHSILLSWYLWEQTESNHFDQRFLMQSGLFDHLQWSNSDSEAEWSLWKHFIEVVFVQLNGSAFCCCGCFLLFVDIIIRSLINIVANSKINLLLEWNMKKKAIYSSSFDTISALKHIVTFLKNNWYDTKEICIEFFLYMIYAIMQIL